MGVLKNDAIPHILPSNFIFDSVLDSRLADLLFIISILFSGIVNIPDVPRGIEKRSQVANDDTKNNLCKYFSIFSKVSMSSLLTKNAKF